MAASFATAVVLVSGMECKTCSHSHILPLQLLLTCTGTGLALEISGMDDDPCAYHVCKEGEVCKVVYNHLLQVPVAACHEVAANHSGGKCKIMVFFFFFFLFFF